MTQSRHSQAISLQMTPMQLPEAAPVAAEATSWVGATGAIASTDFRRNLLLRPGEASEMVVQIKNLATHNLQLTLHLEGDFPRAWYQIGMEGTELPPGRTMESVLYFQLPEDFFEADQTSSPRETLKLNYQGTLHAHSVEVQTGWRQVETAAFNLYVRPRSLYLNFLPSIYREIDFIGRFLKIFEQSFEPTVHVLEDLWAYLDPLTAPEALLPFLSHWLAWNFQPADIALDRQRQLIRSAMQIYRWRGTRRGLRFYLHLATGLPLDDHLPKETDKHICITESFSRGAVFGEAFLGEDTLIGGGRPYHFTVQLSSDRPDQIDEPLVRGVIEQEKPAFCTYDLYIRDRDPSYAATLPPASN